MQDFSLETLGIIVGSVLAFLAACILMPPLLKYGPRVGRTILDFTHDAFFYFFVFKWERNMSSHETEPPNDELVQSADLGGASAAALQRQHQVNDVSHQSGASERALPSLHMAREEEIAWLAGMKQEDGTYRHSANKIAALMGGTESVVKAQVAAIRTPDRPKIPNGTPLKRPANGW